jgi:uncharacterized protein (TIGR02996 family)
MSELDLLYAEVLQNLEADEPRVAYADTVDKTDPDRAELIRVQLQLTHSSRKGTDLATDYNRQRRLLDRHKEMWATSVTEVPGLQFVGFFRGFVEYVEMTARDFLAYGERVYARAPILHRSFVIDMGLRDKLTGVQRNMAVSYRSRSYMVSVQS